MDNLGSEVGQKMRSAVKAKLIELGTGGLAGYIDDELPDYVMIMIANKRSKQQMIGDLQLFLGSQTELFVTWLHEVLQKLQEVTLPAAVVHKTKRKSEANDTPVAGKKDKKEKKKEKDKKVKKTTEQVINKDSNQISAASISDVFADHLLQKAKKTMQNESVMTAKVKKGESSSNIRITRDEFDIPTITEISESVEEISRKKDLEELSKIQKKIYQAKAKLKLTEMEESEDEDYLNIRAEGEELDEVVTEKTESRRSKRNPIVYDSNDKSSENKFTESSKDKRTYELEKSKKRVPITFSNDQKREDENREVQKRKSVHDRLGFNTKNSNNNESTFRRLDRESVPPSTLRSRSSEKAYESRFSAVEKEERDKNTQQSRERSSDENSTVRRRIGSRVIVAPPKKNFEESEDYEEITDKTVNSMIKIKPRPSISPSKQASKNLLLRAVAEAQKSTALVQSKKDLIRDRSPKRLNTRPTKLHTKSLRSRIRESVMKRITKDNIVIEIKSNKPVRNQGDDVNNKSDDEYVPEPVYERGDSDNDYVYIPQTINFDAVDDVPENYDEDRRYPRNKTQFVVTLDDKTRKKYITTQHKSRLLDKCLNGLEKGKLFAKDTRNTKISHSSSYDEDSCTSQHDYSSPRIRMSQKLAENQNSKKSEKPEKPEKSNLLNKPKEQVKKLIIKPDSDDDDNNFNLSKEEDPPREDNKEAEDGSLTPPLPKQSVSNSPLMKRKRSPIKFDLDDNKNKKGETIKEKIEQNSKESPDANNEENTQKILIKKLEAAKKYENIPESLSSIAVEAPNKGKAKERCKYFPTCGKGDSCEYFHPTMPCKAFPNCKFVEKCLYLHPKCKFDLTCNRINCNFSHSAPSTTNTAPPLSSHVVPVQNYKSISANALPAICKYYPNCTNSLCTFYHPKLCRFGKNCMNKVECNFYHFDLPVKDKFKWVASA